MSENEVEDHDIDENTTVNEVYSDSEEEWDEDELQKTISDMKSDHVVMNENDGVQDKNKTDELEESGDELDEVVPSEKINDEVAEVVAPAPRTTRSGNSYAQAVQRCIEYSRESGLFLTRMINEAQYRSTDEESSFSQQFSLRKGLKKFGIKGKVAAQAEVQQLYERESFEPILVKNLTNSERKGHRNLLCF